MDGLGVRADEDAGEVVELHFLVGVDLDLGLKIDSLADLNDGSECVSQILRRAGNTISEYSDAWEPCKSRSHVLRSFTFVVNFHIAFFAETLLTLETAVLLFFFFAFIT